MISLHLHNQPLELLPGATVTITAVCPVFDRGAIDRVYTFPFKVGATPANLNLLRHPQRLDSDAKRVLPGARLFLQGVAFQEGVIEIVKVESTSIEIVFKSHALYLSERLRATRLRTLSMLVAVPGADYLPVIDLLYGDPVEALPISYLIALNGTLYENSLASGLVADINADFPSLASFTFSTGSSFYLHLDTAEAPDIVINLAPSSPGDPGTEYIFATHDPQQTTAEETLRDAWQDHLAAILALPESHVFPTVHAPDFYKNNPAYLNPYINYTNTDGDYPANAIGAVLDPGEGPTEAGWPRAVVPMPFVNEVLVAIFSAVNLTDLGGAWSESEELDTLVVFNTRSLDLIYHPRDFSDPDTVAAFGYVIAPFNGWANAYNLADHLPDITAMEFLDRLATTFCLCYTLPGGRPRISFCRDLLTAEPEDWTPKTEAGYTGTLATTTGYTLDYDRQSDDTLIAGQLERVDGGNNAQEFIAGWFTCFMARLTESEREWLLPTTEQEGQSQYYNASAKQSMRLLFYRGVQQDSEGNSYPLATHGLADTSGETVGSISLDWNGENGRYQQFFQEYVRILSTGSSITRLVRLSVADLVELLEWRHIIKTLYSEDGAFTGVVKSVRFKVSLSGMSAAEVEFVKI